MRYHPLRSPHTPPHALRAPHLPIPRMRSSYLLCSRTLTMHTCLQGLRHIDVEEQGVLGLSTLTWICQASGAAQGSVP